MKNIILSGSMALLIAIGSCSEKQENSGFRIKGKITNNTDKIISLNEITNQGLILLDTATVNADGTFELQGKVSEKTFSTITTPNGAVVLVLDSASDIVVSIDAQNPDAFGVNGSAESEELRKIMQANNVFMIAMRNMENKYASLTKGNIPSASVQAMIRNEYDSILLARKSELVKLANNTNNVVAYFVTNFLLPDADFEFLKQVDERLYSNMPASKYAAELHGRVEMMKKTAIGQAAPEIIQNDPFGKSVALSSLRGKYVLVDFWASWCRPCREENPNVVRMYNKYKTRGFDVFSVSLDDNKDAWIKAINDDKLLWTHVSDLQKWNSSVVKDYNIEGIPFTVLLDKEGKILAKNLRGKQLEEKLAELMGNF
jgi:thiol-disulfide isomerase/thioredoxin